MSHFSAVGDGIEAGLDPAEIAIMLRLTTLLGSAGVDKDDPAREWLNHNLYAGDDAASREFARLTAKESAEVRSTDRQVFADSVRSASGGTITLSTVDAASWARVLNESRIVLAARSGLLQTAGSMGAPTGTEGALIALLGEFQEELIAEMSKMMGDEL